MKLQYGAYTHAPGECQIVITREPQRSSHGVPEGVRERWEIMGMLHADTVALLTTAIGSLESNYVDGFDLKLLNDDNSATAHSLLTANVAGGTRIVKPPSFPQGSSSEYTTYRSYQVAVEGLYKESGSPLLEWAETISFEGTGGSMWKYFLPATGAAQKQTLREQTTYKAVQQGRAVGLDAYVSAPSPIWSTHEHTEQRQISYELPATNSGRRVTTWRYVFESSSPLTGSPTTSAIS